MDEPDQFVPWQRATERVLEICSVIITELTVSYWGYLTQINVPLRGREPSPFYRKLFDVALECYEKCQKYLPAGCYERGTRR
jgi:hypothetical protein